MFCINLNYVNKTRPCEHVDPAHFVFMVLFFLTNRLSLWVMKLFFLIFNGIILLAPFVSWTHDSTVLYSDNTANHCVVAESWVLGVIIKEGGMTSFLWSRVDQPKRRLSYAYLLQFCKLGAKINYRGHSTPMSTWKSANLRWFLTVYYVPELTLLLGAIGAKLIGPNSGHHVGK